MKKNITASKLIGQKASLSGCDFLLDMIFNKNATFDRVLSARPTLTTLLCKFKIEPVGQNPYVVDSIAAIFP